MVDFHSHILPGIDDGAKDIETAGKMLELSKKQGVNTIVATPHFYATHSTVEEFLEKRSECYNGLMRYIEENKLDVPEIILGAEVAFSEKILKVDLRKLCIENTDTVLIELPFTYLNDWVYSEMYNLSMRYGVDIVLAHIERYVGKRNDFSKLEPFFDLDLTMQVNADTFIDRKFKKIVKELMARGKVDVIGSDFHNLSKRISNMDKAARVISKKYGENKLNSIMVNARKLINK